MINKENILSYAKLVNKVISDDSYKLTDDDNRILNYMKELIKNNPKYADFAEKIIDMNGNIDQILRKILMRIKVKKNKLRKHLIFLLMILNIYI